MTEVVGTTALLGPTNTGKTHRAIERMLEHATGMIGLPLRLLAREVYDRVTAKVGEARVALVTGEEQRIPPRPSYWIATVEAMPVERDVEFVAVDEVQLAAHDQRGHVFTSRILHARGTKETWLLGSGTMRPILRDLVPAARQVEHPRLSRLAYAGAHHLSRVPPRSALVAFSMTHVYELAERLRARKGGAAVVLGGLSPRTRNAQVAMFQAGEVDWLVATDAIGMGLNLDVEHVAFAATRKFDGREVRDVDEAELAQIAGRAGRYVQDGTFGTISPLELPNGVVSSIETHHFPPVRRVRWRNIDLAFDSVEALRESLHVPPPRKVLVSARDAEDATALERLALRPEIAKLARGEDAVRLLWDVCTIPDFRKLLFEVHVDFLEQIYRELMARGRIDDDFMNAALEDLDHADGDVETLVARISSVRTWTYVANRTAWLVSPAEWQEKTRLLEDRLSDALHERLVMRFVDVKGKKTKRARPRPPGSSARLPEFPDDRESSPADGHPFAALAAMKAKLAPPARESSRDLPGSPAWVEEIIDGTHDAFRLEETGRIVHLESGRHLAQLVRGAAVSLPDVKLLDVDDLGGGAQRRVHRRMLAYARDVVVDLLGGLRDLALAPPEASGVEAQAALRGLVHRLEQGLGTALARDVDDLVSVLDAPAKSALEEAGLVLGAAAVFLPRGLTSAALSSRVALVTTAYGAAKALHPPPGGAVSFVASRGVSAAAFAAIGYPVVGGRAIRADVVERVAARLAEPGDAPPASDLASWLGVPARELARVLGAGVIRS